MAMIVIAMIGVTQIMVSVLTAATRAAPTGDMIDGIPAGMRELTTDFSIMTVGTADGILGIIGDTVTLTGIVGLAFTAITLAAIFTAAETATDIYHSAILIRTPAR